MQVRAREDHHNTAWKDEAFWSNFRAMVLQSQPYFKSLKRPGGKQRKNYLEEKDTALYSQSRRRAGRSQSPPSCSTLGLQQNDNFTTSTSEIVRASKQGKSYCSIKLPEGQSAGEKKKFGLIVNAVENDDDSDIRWKLENELNHFKTELAISQAKRDEMEMEILQLKQHN